MESEYSDEEVFEKVYYCSCQNCDPKTGRCPINCEEEYDGPLMTKKEIEEYKKIMKEKYRIKKLRYEEYIKNINMKKEKEERIKRKRDKIKKIIKIQSIIRCYFKRNLLKNKKKRLDNQKKNKERRKNRVKYKKKRRR